MFTASRPNAAKQTSQRSEQQQLGDRSINVTRLESKSRASNDLDPGDNPMEQPQFGAPSSKTYYVSSSQFTSSDVEEFKRISLQKSKATRSECSSSSHISCPDPPHMNISPAAYVDKLYHGSPSSVVSSEILDHKDRGSCISRESSGQFNLSQDDANEFGVKSVDSQTFSADYDAPVYDSDLKVEGNTKSNNSGQDNVGEQPTKSELEDSLEEFYKSPLRKESSDMGHRKVQRLESINQEIREEAILKGFEEIEAKKEASVASELLESTHTVVAEDDDCTDEAVDEEEFDAGLDLVSVIENCDAEVVVDDQSATEDKIQAEDISAGTSELLDISQKLLNELGIEDKNDDENVGDQDNTDKDTTEGDKEESMEPIHIEEKVTVDTDDEGADIVHTNQKKKKKVRESDSIEKLKPVLSLSPPNPRGSDPELSDAVADRVVQIRHTENPDFLKKHRLSLPVKGSLKGKSNFKKRQSSSESEGKIESGSIDTKDSQECIYKDTSDEDLSGTQSASPLENKDEDQNVQGRQSRTISRDSIDTEEDAVFHRFVTCCLCGSIFMFTLKIH